MVDNIPNHASENNPKTKAIILAKIIDGEDPEVGKTIKRRSKVIQETDQLNAELTTTLITGARTSDRVWRKFRTATKNVFGYSTIASQKKVDEQREKMMTVKKEDWSFDKKIIYQNKQGVNKGVPKETSVLMVKDLFAYIVKFAETEKADLDLSSGELPICFDADAGAS